MTISPPPSRPCLDTSPPLREVEDGSLAERPSSNPTQWGGGAEHGGKAAVGEAEGGINQLASRSRRKAGTTERARRLRWVENSAEGLIWQELKGRQLGGHHFVRQHPIGPYYADFCCRKKRLVVELDGSQHAGSDHDRRRDAFMRSEGYSVLRFWSSDTQKHRRSICETILAALDGRLNEDATAFDLRFVFAPDSNPQKLRVSP